jgi:hypothetical protein
MDGKFLTEMARGDSDGWGRFVLDAGTQNKFPNGFPLKAQKVLVTGLFLADRPRWPAP